MPALAAFSIVLTNAPAECDGTYPGAPLNTVLGMLNGDDQQRVVDHGDLFRVILVPLDVDYVIEEGYLALTVR